MPFSHADALPGSWREVRVACFVSPVYASWLNIFSHADCQVLTSMVHPNVLEPSCTKTVPKPPSDCDLRAYFEREADSPKLLKALKGQSKGSKYDRTRAR